MSQTWKKYKTSGGRQWFSIVLSLSHSLSLKDCKQKCCYILLKMLLKREHCLKVEKLWLGNFMVWSEYCCGLLANIHWFCMFHISMPSMGCQEISQFFPHPWKGNHFKCQYIRNSSDGSSYVQNATKSFSNTVSRNNRLTNSNRVYFLSS